MDIKQYPGRNLASKEQQLEREFAKFIKEQISRGPKKIEVKIANDTVICLIDGFLTKAEELIVESGHWDKVMVYRCLYVTKCVNGIEEILQLILKKKIRFFFPSWIPERNLACWTIYLD
ncbi:MAG TPA: Na-translocating system protein MpsC family protein [Methylomusa anaerophila]|uniref:Na+-translocating membrane potential-generating system MpsC domain-containing protein n=1 Tax=Methylomusa anaerophila TaxID=1930071 RepID=A0A348AEX1_9FIRM|nr:Na-translocating system protein MpsC family protein [Methylomusa anaerophila]BBB89619.1 hypothetical protein MAMMFC1_00252 [Methylomusa anaerophila]HML89608.1 Na-translocating system protein MpsC family protein [Methylomusa anaerophila]